MDSSDEEDKLSIVCDTSDLFDDFPDCEEEIIKTLAAPVSRNFMSKWDNPKKTATTGQDSVAKPKLDKKNGNRSKLTAPVISGFQRKPPYRPRDNFNEPRPLMETPIFPAPQNTILGLPIQLSNYNSLQAYSLFTNSVTYRSNQHIPPLLPNNNYKPNLLDSLYRSQHWNTTPFDGNVSSSSHQWPNARDSLFGLRQPFPMSYSAFPPRKNQQPVRFPLLKDPRLKVSRSDPKLVVSSGFADGSVVPSSTALNSNEVGIAATDRLPITPPPPMISGWPPSPKLIMKDRLGDYCHDSEKSEDFNQSQVNEDISVPSIETGCSPSPKKLIVKDRLGDYCFDSENSDDSNHSPVHEDINVPSIHSAHEDEVNECSANGDGIASENNEEELGEEEEDAAICLDRTSPVIPFGYPNPFGEFNTKKSKVNRFLTAEFETRVYNLPERTSIAQLLELCLPVGDPVA